MTHTPKRHEHPQTSSEIRYVNLYESEGKVYTRRISGFYQRLRRYTGVPLMLGFLLLPWLTIDGRPAVLFDLAERKFHILWVTFWPQDFMLLAWLLIISAFALFAVTVLVGRVWCGFTCPQTVWTLIFIAVEHLCEGDRNKRIKLDKQPWSGQKLLRKSSKHALWLLIAFITGATFIGYFTPIRELLLGFIPHRADSGFIYFDIHPVAAFWTLFFTGMTYLNAGWMREQVCKYMCPYARFQAVMYDRDTLAVYYDSQRGEQRGPRRPGDDYQKNGLGDCTDCSWCVQVCPVAIDIREGLQYECINCGLCVDACNAVMDKMAYPRGLIRFTSDHQLQTGKTRFWRPRLFGYCAVLLVMVGAFGYAIATRSPLSVDVMRDRGARLYRLVGDQVQNVYTLRISNMDNSAHSYIIELEGDANFELHNYRPTPVDAGEVITLPVRVMAPRTQLRSEKNTIRFRVRAETTPDIEKIETSVFMGPAR